MTSPRVWTWIFQASENSPSPEKIPSMPKMSGISRKWWVYFSQRKSSERAYMLG